MTCPLLSRGFSWFPFVEERHISKDHRTEKRFLDYCDCLWRSTNDDPWLGRRKVSGAPLPMNKLFSLSQTRLFLPWEFLPRHLDTQLDPGWSTSWCRSSLQLAAAGPNVFTYKLCRFTNICLHRLRQLPIFKSYRSIKSAECLHSKRLSFLHQHPI